jgi:Peptidase family M28
LFLLHCKFNSAQIKGEKTSSEKILLSSKTDSTQLIADLYTLSADSMEGREAGTFGGQKAANYLKKRMSDLALLPFKDGFTQSFPLKKGIGVNLNGFIKGKKEPEKYFVLSAHYDHLGIKKGEIYNGADDNASGVAVLLSLAAYFQKNPPQHSIVFCFFDAEEKGLLGAKAWVENPPIPINQIDLNVNLDMVSRSEKKEIYFSGLYHAPQLKEILESDRSESIVNVKFGHDRPEDGQDDWTSQSDHYHFHLAKIPFLYVGVEDHKDYHQHTDEADKIDKKYYTAVNQLLRQTVENLDKKMLEKI